MKDADVTQIERAAQALRRGELVVFPTETVYGLGANAFSESAVAGIYAAKGRPADNPLIVHLRDVDQLNEVATHVPQEAYTLFAAFSPGPLTVVLQASDALARKVSAGLGTVAVRIPQHPVARLLLERTALPVAAPSANRSGEPSPTTVAMSRHSLGDAVSWYLDGGPCEVGLESTVVALEPDRVVILRPGAITSDQISAVLPRLQVDEPTRKETLHSSPGTRHRHYHPRADVVLINPSASNARDVRQRLEGVSRETPVGVIRSVRTRWEEDVVEGERRVELCVYGSLEEYARNLYRWFAELDRGGCGVIVAEVPGGDGIAVALRDRLTRAAAD